MKPIRIGMLLLIPHLLASTGDAGEIRTDEIIGRTLDASFACMQWQPVGLCFWLDCNLFSCSVNTSLKVRHYNPDLVISSYNALGENPWDEAQAILGAAQSSVARSILGQLLAVIIDSAGNRTEGRSARDHNNLVFRETDAIGHPGLALLDALPDSVRCQSESQALVPYFQSSLDALAWRTSLPESFYPASLIPGQREIGPWPAATWGSVYPRSGWTIQAEEPKAAAITAQRAGDIVTRIGQPHLYLPLLETESAEQQLWSPGPLIEYDADTGTWQMLLPVVDDECEVFGIDDRAGPSWAQERVDEGGDYVWNLWRPYECCEAAGQVFLLDVDLAGETP